MNEFYHPTGGWHTIVTAAKHAGQNIMRAVAYPVIMIAETLTWADGETNRVPEGDYPLAGTGQTSQPHETTAEQPQLNA
ncbi:MAG TPA: hypothetical protein VF261_01815 [Candidatus Saccharimonadales bacterium]